MNAGFLHGRDFDFINFTGLDEKNKQGIETYFSFQTSSSVFFLENIKTQIIKNKLII